MKDTRAIKVHKLGDTTVTIVEIFSDHSISTSGIRVSNSHGDLFFESNDAESYASWLEGMTEEDWRSRYEDKRLEEVPYTRDEPDK